MTVVPDQSSALLLESLQYAAHLLMICCRHHVAAQVSD